MSNGIGNEIFRIVALIAIFAGIATLWDQTAWGIIIALASYLIWSLMQLQKVYNWLNQKEPADPPESHGIWGKVFDGVYHLQRSDKEEKSRLQATIEYLQNSFSSLNDAVVMLDKRGNIVWNNESATHLLGLRYPQDQKQYIANLIREPRFARYFDSGDYKKSLEINSPNKPHISLQVNITLFGEGNKLLFARDISTLKQLETMRGDFVANVSHELRTPLTVLQGYLETFEDHPPNNDERWKKALKHMLNQSRRMDALVRDLLTLSRLETVPMEEKKESINVKQLSEEICQGLEGVIEKRTIINKVPPEARLKGVRMEIQSAFTNLISNAIRYSDPNGEIQILWDENDHGKFYTVKDNGIGIEPGNIHRLTERFFCVDKSRSAKSGGTGLGLAIVKHILLRHHATLKITSRLGEGSSFTCCFVELPGQPEA